MKKVLNFFGIVLAVLFSLALIPTLILNPVWRGVSDLMEPEFLQGVVGEMMEEIDLSELALQDPDLMQTITDSGLTAEAAEAVLSSQFMKDLLELAGKDLTLVLEGNFTAASLTEAELLGIVTDNLDELVSIARLTAPEEFSSLTDDQLAQFLLQAIQEQLPTLQSEIVQAFSGLQEDLHNDEVAAAFELISGPLVPTVLLVAALVLALLIFLCRWPHQEGLLWLGIDSAIAALPVLAMAISLKGSQLAQMLAQTAGLPNVFGPALRRMGNTTLIGGSILLVIAVLFIAGFIILRDRRMKRQATHADYAPHAAASQAMPVEEVTVSEPTERSPWDNVQ